MDAINKTGNEINERIKKIAIKLLNLRGRLDLKIISPTSDI
jgi:hypothetical protein